MTRFLNRHKAGGNQQTWDWQAMTGRNIEGLVQRYRRNRSVQQMEREAGLPEGSLRNYISRERTTTNMPRTSAMEKMAAALGCSVEEVRAAFAADLAHPSGDDMPAEVQQLVALVSPLPQHQRDWILRIVKVVVRGDGERKEQ